MTYQAQIETATQYGPCADCGATISPGERIRHVPSMLPGYDCTIHARCPK